MAVTLNDNGPDADSLDGPLWKSKEESLRDSRRKDNIRDSPAEIPMDDIIAGLNKLRVRPPSTEPPPSLPRYKLSRRSITNIRAHKVLVVLDHAEKTVGDLSKALEESMESPSREKLDSIQEELSTLRKAVVRSHLASTAIRSKRAELVPRLDELGVRLQQARDLLPETDKPKEYPIGKLVFHLISTT
jgi:DNA-binding transcriptional ArsR family regulator